MHRLEWANLLSTARVQKDMIVIQQQSESAMSEIARIERRYRYNISAHFLYVLCGTKEISYSDDSTYGPTQCSPGICIAWNLYSEGG